MVNCSRVPASVAKYAVLSKVSIEPMTTVETPAACIGTFRSPISEGLKLTVFIFCLTATSSFVFVTCKSLLTHFIKKCGKVNTTRVANVAVKLS